MFWILQIIKRAAAYLQNLNVEVPRSSSSNWMADPNVKHHRCESFGIVECPRDGIYTLKMGLDRAHLCERHARLIWGVNPF